MSTWVIISWVAVALLTGVNIFAFLQLKKASEEMLKAAFPGARDVNDALSKMQDMMKNAQRGRPHPMLARSMGKKVGAKAAGQEAQLQAALTMLQNMQKKK
ncbi:MAG TPA: hypothetical protein VL588_03385 [Bdellovibrionota bacterium]|jgi:hypothetical protein|nr:hypothetical protein [Bdellovibrionota bacterium]